ncbi:hypothetical protein DENIS_4817 [Desulfonema ishimotonii]|uniref:Uncharacterized protein n=1 Tax=Desulfonema ishimotonii TaxID=45657 RepID=A0A401G3K4_9BACT|nr:hypothetical protein DENIS_4817 [Desulfonema ishimotonii]
MNNLTENTADSPPPDILTEQIAAFGEASDAGTLFRSRDSADFETMRQQVRNAFFALLTAHRPFLERTRGLSWPYEMLRCREATFAHLARNGETPFVRHQVRLFLTLLPFPGQWRRLSDAEQASCPHPEIEEFIRGEQRKTAAKLRKKSQKTFKLRHFCQILKRPDLPREKGVLRIFSLPYLFADSRLLNALNRQYFLYIEPPWGVLARHAWLRAFSCLEDPCLFGVGGREDADFLAGQPGILTTPLAHGDFLEDLPPESAGEKQFDIVFNATFDDMPRKRHRFMLTLLSHPLLKDATALFIGRGAEKNVAACRQMIREPGLSDRVTLCANLMRRDVPAYLARCRVGVQVSQHENACRSIYECFRADLPCAVSSAMAGFNFDLFSDQNGVVAPDRMLPRTISEMLGQTARFAPRSWFLKHSGSLNSTRMLNHQLRGIFSQLGYAWQTDIVPLGSSGASRYVDHAHHEMFRPESESLLKIFRSQPELPVRLVI